MFGKRTIIQQPRDLQKPARPLSRAKGLLNTDTGSNWDNDAMPRPQSLSKFVPIYLNGPVPCLKLFSTINKLRGGFKE